MFFLLSSFFCSVWCVDPFAVILLGFFLRVLTDFKCCSLNRDPVS